MPVIELSIKNVLVGTFTEDASIWFATPNPSRANWPQKTRRAFWNLLPNSLVSFGKLFFGKKESCYAYLFNFILPIDIVCSKNSVLSLLGISMWQFKGVPGGGGIWGTSPPIFKVGGIISNVPTLFENVI